MNTKLYNLAAGLAALGALAGGEAVASHAPPYNSAVETIVYMSGASAVDRGLYTVVRDTMCQANTLYFLNVDGTAQNTSAPASISGNGWGIACDASATSGLPTGTNVVFIKRSAGGSGFGVQAVAQQTQIAFLNPAGASTGPTPAGCTAGSNCRWDLTTNTNAVPDAGLSDADPLQFIGVNTPPGFSPVTTTDIGNLTIKSVFAESFGVVVNMKLYQALQYVQFPADIFSLLTGNLANYALQECNPSSPSYPANGNLEKCMPTLSRDFIQSVMTGKITDWNQVNVQEMRGPGVNASVGSKIAGKLTSTTLVPAALQPTSSTLRFCRRFNGSGTQAIANIAFLDYPYNQFAELPLISLTGAGVNRRGDGNGLFPPGSGSGDVEKCLVSYNQGTADATWQTLNNSTGATVTTTLNSNNAVNWALGILSTDRVADPTARSNTLGGGSAPYVRFIKVDGVKPGIKDVDLGQHHYWGTLTMQWNPNYLNGTGDRSAQFGFVNAMYTQMVSPALAANLNSESAQHTWGVGGFAAVPENLSALPQPNPWYPPCPSATGGVTPFYETNAFDPNRTPPGIDPNVGAYILFSHAPTATGIPNNSRRPSFYNDGTLNNCATVNSLNVPGLVP